MKKLTLYLLMMAGIAGSVSGQLSSGGFPLSVREKITPAPAPLHTYASPDWEKAQSEQKAAAENGLLTPYTIGLSVPADIRFPESGSFTYLPDGRTIWRSTIRINEAPAMGFYYDAFHLPEGVSYFISNENGRHILGAYTSRNNRNGLFANEAVQGEAATLELDIAPGVKTGDISLHINKILVYYTSIAHLRQYINTAARPTGSELDTPGSQGGSAACQINATCPLGWNYSIQRRAAIQFIKLTGAGTGIVCSATMLNNTGNTPGNCTQYILTASHCESDNDSTNAPVFDQVLLRFHYEKPNCNNTTPATTHTLTGVELVARSSFIAPGLFGQPAVNGDFMLLKPKETIPADWEINLNGWNRADSLPAELTYPKQYSTFHHPRGDIKKVTTFKTLNPLGEAGGDDGPGTHWLVDTDSGRIQQGSSGGGLIDGNGFTIGIASVATDLDTACRTSVTGQNSTAFKTANYSKLSYVWDYAKDGDADFRKLKPWLDPANTGVVTLDPVSATCGTPFSGTPLPLGIRNITNLEQNVVLYPNPTTTGTVLVHFNFNKSRDVQISVHDITGKALKQININNAGNGIYSIDLSGMSNGMYLIRIHDGQEQISKKVMLNKQ